MFSNSELTTPAMILLSPGNILSYKEKHSIQRVSNYNKTTVNKRVDIKILTSTSIVMEV